jgi:RHS repeat-associated protein
MLVAKPKWWFRGISQILVFAIVASTGFETQLECAQIAATLRTIRRPTGASGASFTPMLGRGAANSLLSNQNAMTKGLPLNSGLQQTLGGAPLAAKQLEKAIAVQGVPRASLLYAIKQHLLKAHAMGGHALKPGSHALASPALELTSTGSSPLVTSLPISAASPAASWEPASTLGAMAALPNVASNGNFIAFGPQDYQRETGAPITVTSNFSVLNPNTQYTLKAFNGGLQDDLTELVSSGVVTVNGVQVLGPNNLSQNITEVDVPVSLQASNTLSVQLRGKPGGVLTIEIIGVDNDPPTIQATVSPTPNAAGWNNTNVTVTFVCGDATSPVTSCPSPQTITTEGANQVVSGTATDAAGNTATTSVTLKIDKTPPVITAASSPAPNAAGWNNSDVTVSFTCSDSISGVASCPSPVVMTAETAGLSVSGTATDIAGNTASTSITVKLDKTPPTISLTSPANNSTVSVSTLQVSGTVTDALSGVASASCNGVAASLQNGAFTCSLTLTPGANNISVTATDVAGNTASQSLNVTLISLAIADFNPKSGPSGTLVTLSGTGFQSGGSPGVALSRQGGGTIPAPISSASDSSISFVIPAGAASGAVTVTSGQQSTASSAALSVVARTSFTVSAAPTTATLIQGKSTTYAITLNSADGFTQLAQLGVSGLPSGVTASFLPSQITNGQTSILTLTAPAGQPASTNTLTISASATVDGIPANLSATVAVAVQAATTSLIGRIVESDTNESPLEGITITLLGVDDAANATGCTGTTVSDAGGNFSFLNLPAACLGRQLAGYNGNTATDGEKYASINLAYTINAGQVTGPALVHLPRIDNNETKLVKQNSSTDQTFTFSTIPGLIITVYAGTVFTLPDGTQPDPFPLSAVQIPVDRLPDTIRIKEGNGLRAYIVAFQPAFTKANQPVAITFPNSLNTPPGVNMELDTLHPLVGAQVKYGTGTVSGDGTQIVPDLDPAHPGQRFGLVYFDWHGPQAPPPPGPNPPPPGDDPPPGPHPGEPVDTSSGLYILQVTDLEIRNSLGRIGIDRVYRTLSGNPGPFGVGTGHNYGYQLNTFAFIQGQGFITLVAPDGNQFPFNRQLDGTLKNSTIPFFRGAVMTNPSNGIYVLRFKDQTAFQFQSPSSGPRIAYLNAITDRNGNVTNLVHGNASSPVQITQVIHPSGQKLTLTYDNFDRIISIIDPIARRVSYTYNPQGMLATVTTTLGGVIQYSYDSQNRLATSTDSRGITSVQNIYDQNGRVIQQILANGGVFNFSYTLLNPNVPTSPVLLTTVIDPVGNRLTYHFSPQGMLLDATDGLGRQLVYNLEPGSNLLLSTVDALNRETDFTRDPNGNITSVTRLAGTPDAVQTFYTYDPVFNQVTSVKDPLGNVTNLTYDTSGNLTATTDSLGNKFSNTYNSAGQLIASTDALGNTTQFTYSGGDLVQLTDPLGRVTNLTVDGNSRLLAVTNALGQSTSRQYNAYNELTQITDPLGRNISFNYDLNGNLTSITDGLGNSRTIAYDGMNRPISQTDSLGAIENLQYDLNGLPIQFTDRRGVITVNQYDTVYRQIFTGFGQSGGAFESTIAYSYDAGDRLVQLNDSSFGTLSQAYDGLDRLVNEITPRGNINYSYDAAGRRTAMRVKGEQSITYYYDNDNRLIQIVQGNSTVAFGYDADSRRTRLILPDGITVSSGYNAASELTSLIYASAAGPLGNLAYTYDSIGRITSTSGSFARTNIPAALSGISYNSNNELAQSGSSILTYDANGNLLSDAFNTYIWNARNQLIAIGGAVTANFKYDPFGRRDEKTVSGATTDYLYDGPNIVQERSAGAPTANLLTGLAIDEIFLRSDSSGASNFLTGTVSSTLALADSSGSITTSYTYSPYGDTTSDTGSSNSFQYTTRENDGTGLYYYRDRYYNPRIGRFISEDPILASPNLYAYASGNPISRFDPTGDLDQPTGQNQLGVGQDPLQNRLDQQSQNQLGRPDQSTPGTLNLNLPPVDLKQPPSPPRIPPNAHGPCPSFLSGLFLAFPVPSVDGCFQVGPVPQTPDKNPNESSPRLLPPKENSIGQPQSGGAGVRLNGRFP